MFVNVFAWLRYATFVNVPAVLILVPFNWIALVPFTVAPCNVAVVVMLFPVEIVPKPLAIEPEVSAPVDVMLPCTALGNVWLRLGTFDPLVTNILFAAAAVTCTALVPLP